MQQALARNGRRIPHIGHIQRRAHCPPKALLRSIRWASKAFRHLPTSISGASRHASLFAKIYDDCRIARANHDRAIAACSRLQEDTVQTVEKR